jgi:plasmid stabilization system protein ParE
MAEIIWTKWAIKDLKSIFEFVSIDSKFYAVRFIDSIISRVDQLSKYPLSGRIVPEKKQSSYKGVDKW